MTIDNDTIAFAHRLAEAAGEVIRPYFRKAIDVADKRPTIAGKAIFDPVTQADKRAEETIRAIIERERPEDAILGEEFGLTPGTSGFTWVLDPVDGTRSFINGRHEWGCLIALEEYGRPVLGVIDQPVLGERFVGANGRTRFHSKGQVTTLKTRPCERIEDAILCATHPDAFFGPGERDAFRRVEKKTRLTRWGGDCYIFAVLALGFADVIVETAFNHWDVAALIPVVEGAGGVITNWQGESCALGGQCLAAGDARIHAAAVQLLNGG